MSKITIWIPSMPQRSYAYRRGDAQIIHDDEKNAIIIDGGEDEICNQLISYCKNHGITHVTYILSHWHPDHDRGMKLFLDSSIIVDKIICPPPSDLTRLSDKSDYSRAMERIAQATRLKKPISYPPAEAYTDIKVGAIVCRIWRRAPKSSENYDYQVNNTSLCCYFPELFYLTTGDTINAFETFLNKKPGTITVFKVPHHGNACTSDPCSLLKAAGAQLCWYNHAEAYGVGIGGDDFSKWGAAYCKKHFVTLRPFHAITMTAAAGKLAVSQNGSRWSYPIPYAGEAFEGWLKGTKGWWYQFADGSWALGWNKLKWSGGEDWFYFNADGWMMTGWVKNNGYWYYLDPESGAMVTGWLDYKGNKCYLEPDAGKNQGHAYQSQEAVIDGKTYKFDESCYVTDNTAQARTAPSIKQNYNFKGYNVTKRSDPIMYIVMHYTGAEGTAKTNIDYFNGGNRNASADFFVGHDGDIYQYSPDIRHYYSWHCGGGRQSSRGGSLFGTCKNGNSIGIEMCVHKVDGEWILSEKTVNAARDLVKYLMEEYGIPAKRICRHFDVNGKFCPNVANWLEPSKQWDKFKGSLTEETSYDDPPQVYRVRKSWAAADTQVGAFGILDNAMKCAANWPGYHVYDRDGTEII